MTELLITDDLIRMIMEDTGSNRDLANEIAQNLTKLPPALREAAARWTKEFISDEELSKISVHGISLLDIMRREEKRFIEALFTLNVLEENPDLAEEYFCIFPEEMEE